jgi:hypothetical protein
MTNVRDALDASEDGDGTPSSGTQQGASKRKEFRMDWRRLVTDDANETDLLRSYVVRVTDATFGYMAEQAATESGVPAADGRDRMWTLFERGTLRLVGPVTDDDPLAWSLVTATSGMSRRRRTGRWSNGGVRWQQRATKSTIKAPRFNQFSSAKRNRRHNRRASHDEIPDCWGGLAGRSVFDRNRHDH